MLSIVVVDKSASARNQLVAQLHRYLQSGSSELDLLPRISVKPLSLQELRFHEAPDICVVGSELIINELTEVGKIRAQLPHTPLVAQIVEQVSGIATIEQLARMGVTDTIGRDTSAQEFFRKLVLLAQKSEAKRSSKLIVIDSGKGGVGVTSLVASLGEK
ncbi:MAG: hypothetical protein KDD62_15080, partial [Bdellovibrionales bacterium]|nr:hypothetical protein [Bdellovibrionales bacterium]